MNFVDYLLSGGAPASPINPRTSDALAGRVQTPFYPVPSSSRVFIHPAGPREKHGPIRRILFDPPIPSHIIGSPSIPLVVSDDHYAETLPRITDREAFKRDAARTSEQMAEDLLLANFDL
jgi:hypothetical protein